MPSSNPRYAKYQQRVNLRKWLRAQGRPCWICRAFGRPGYIDYSLPAGHPLSFEVDELIPVSMGGSATSRANVDATHRRCNQWRGNRSVDEVMRIARGGVIAAPVAQRVEGVTSALAD